MCFLTFSLHDFKACDCPETMKKIKLKTFSKRKNNMNYTVLHMDMPKFVYLILSKFYGYLWVIFFRFLLIWKVEMFFFSPFSLVKKITRQLFSSQYQCRKKTKLCVDSLTQLRNSKPQQKRKCNHNADTLLFFNRNFHCVQSYAYGL